MFSPNFAFLKGKYANKWQLKKLIRKAVITALESKWFHSQVLHTQVNTADKHRTFCTDNKDNKNSKDLVKRLTIGMQS